MAADAGQVIGRVSVRVMPDTSEFRGTAQRELTRIQAQLRELQVGLRLDRTALNRLRMDLDGWVKRISPIRVEAKPELPNGSVTVINARLLNLSRPREVEIIPRINNTALAGVATALAALSGARVLHGIFSNLFENLMNLGRAVPLIGTITLGIAGLAGAGIAAVGNLAALSAALASIAPAALALPGIFGGVAIGVGVLVAALRDFNTQMPGVRAQLSELQNTISANFWEGFRGPLQELISSLLPQFSTGLTQTATLMGGLFGALATSLTGALDGPIASMFANLNQSIEIARGGTDALANILRILGEVGASYLPRLVQWFVDIGNQFSEWLTEVAEDGRLQGWIDAALVALSDLGRVAQNLGSILLGIGRAAMAGGDLSFGVLADTLSRIATVVNSSAFQTTLTEVFRTANTMMSNLVSGAGPALLNLFSSLAQTFITLGPLIGTTLGVALGAIADALASPAIQQGITSLVVGISTAISALAPAMRPLANVVGLIAQVASQLLAALGPVVSVLVTALAEALSAILPALMPVVQILGDGLLQIVTALSPLLAQLGVVFGQLLTAITPILPVLINLAVSVLTPLISIVMRIISAVLPPLVAAIQNLVSALTPVINAIATAANWLLNFLAPAFVFVGEIIAGAFIDVINALGNVFSGVVNYIQGVWNVFAGLFTGDWGRMWDGIKQVFEGVWEMIKGIFVLALTFLGGSVFRGALNGIRSFWDDTWNAIRNLALQLWDSLRGRWTAFLNDLRAAPGAALDAIRNLFRNAWNDIRAGAEQAWELVRGVFRNGVNSVRSTITSLPGIIRDVFSNAGSLLVNAGRQIIQGLTNGIRSMFGSVRDALGDLTSRLTSWKGPESRDRVLLVDAGRLIMDGFIEGLESRYDAVRRSLRGLTRDVADTQFAIPSVTGGVSSRLASTLEGTVSEGVVQKVLNYYAAAGSSLSSEEDLFAAVGRARMVGW